MALGVEALERETFAAGARLGVKALRLLGKPAYKAERAGRIFVRFDEKLLDEMFAHWRTLPFAEYQRMVRDRTALEEELFRRDTAAFTVAADVDEAWDAEAREGPEPDASR